MAEQPRPKSPPGYLDLYAKRRQQAKLHLLEREIGLLQEELKSLDGVQPSSRCCKELNEFVAAKQDPFLATSQRPHEPNCCWTRNRKKSCLKSSWICCLSGCCKTSMAHNQQQVEKRACCHCCHCCSRENFCLKRCGLQGCSCFGPNCCSFRLRCLSNCCSKVKLCPSCVRRCSVSCCS